MKTIDLPALAELPSDALTARLYQIRQEERGLLVEFLAHLAELDRRKVVLALGYPSLFSFCTDFLGLTKSSAFRRTTAARLLARFPIVGEYLADGRLCLTTLVELRDVLEEARLAELLDRAAGRTEDQVKELAAAVRPQPVPLDLFRRLPVPEVSSGPEPMLVNAGPPAVSAVRPGRVEPIAEKLHVLRVTVGAEFVADLEAVRAALSHKLPGSRLEEVLHECLRTTLAVCHRRRRGAGKRPSAKQPPQGSRYLPAAVRDEVWRRDDGQCTFVGVTGHRCASKYRLELHHVVPFKMGGPSTVLNLTLRCKPHNLYAGELDYGAEHIARAIARKGS